MVTGGAGFLGRWVVKRFEEAGGDRAIEVWGTGGASRELRYAPP